MGVSKNNRACVLSRKKRERVKAPKKEKPVKKVRVKGKKTLIIAQEIKFARLLAHNDKKVRDKVLKNLKRWLTIRAKSSFAFTETDFMRLWKGLFYCMWMSDKPLIQEELSESLSGIVHCFDSLDVVLLYVTCTLKTIATEWFGIDNYRIDKFAMLVRRIFRQIFQICKNNSWSKTWVVGIADSLEKLLFDPKTSQGFIMQVAHLYLEELAKISNGTIPEDMVTEFIKPFALYMTKLNDEREIQYIMRHVFRHLIFQSDVGIDYAQKFEAWRRAGFPCRNIDEMVKEEVSDEDECNEDNEEETQHSNRVERPLDPRAGRVDVELPELQFNAEEIAELFKQYRFHPTSTTKSRRQIAHLIKEFTEVAQGRMPLGINEINLPIVEREITNPTKAALRFLEFEEDLYSDVSKTKQKKKKNRRIEHFQDKLTNKINKEGAFPQNVDESLTDSDNDCDMVDGKDNLNSCKIQTNVKRKQQKNENDIEIEKSKRIKVDKMSNNKQLKSKKAKIKENGLDHIHMTKNSTSPKQKRSKSRDSCGIWDVSESTDTPSKFISNDNDSSITIEDISTPTKSILQNNLSSNEIMWLTPVLTKLKVDQMKPLKSEVKGESASKKRVKIVLHRNTAQNTSEYIQQLRQSPAIPFDANKKPPAGVLKASPIPSPVNPFYKKKL